MREVIYKPINTGDGVIVQYTDSFILDKGRVLHFIQFHIKEVINKKFKI